MININFFSLQKLMFFVLFLLLNEVMIFFSVKEQHKKYQIQDITL